MKDTAVSYSRTKPAGFDRRAFLKGSGAAAAATALAGSEDAALGLEADGAVVAGPQTITLDVNGHRHEIAGVEPRTTLLDVLRYHLNLTGAKPVSVDGSSGASTVLVDGKPVSANIVLVLDCVDRPIRTVESLGGDDPDTVVKAFVHHDAMQCGFCTPGFVMAVRAFLDKHPHATDDEIRAGLNGNLCRCGTYVGVLAAAIEVAKGGRHG
jgi:xanthine dehydrogenase YagT iron-sulfur-binding subunit